MPRLRRKRSALVKSAELIGWALGGLEREIEQTRARLDALIRQRAQLSTRVRGAGRALKSTVASSVGLGGRPRRRRRMSAEARRRISEMMKKRWAARRRKKS